MRESFQNIILHLVLTGIFLLCATGVWILTRRLIRQFCLLSCCSRIVAILMVMIATLVADKLDTNRHQRVGHKSAVTMRQHGHGGHRGDNWFGHGFRHNGSHTLDGGEGQSSDGGMQPVAMLPFADGDSPLALDAASLAAGFALAGIGTGEVWDFSPTENAVFATNWLKRGAAEDALAIVVSRRFRRDRRLCGGSV